MLVIDVHRFPLPVVREPVTGCEPSGLRSDIKEKGTFRTDG